MRGIEFGGEASSARGAARRLALIAALTALGWLGASSASALIITSSGTSLPGGGSCSVSGITTVSTGATVTCTGINLAAHTKVYFGIRNDANVNGNTMTGSAPTSGSAAVFRSSSTGASQIAYTSTTTITSLSGFGTDAVTNTLNLTRTAGTATVVATGGSPANNGFGDIGHLFQITSGTTLTLDVDILAVDPHFTGQASTAVYNNSHPSAGAGGEISKVDVTFYWSNCGDGQVDSPEQCDQGAANGTSTSCCSSTCTFKNNTSVCRTSAGECDPQEVCSGSSASCPANAFVAAGTPCTDSSPASSGNCKDAQCNNSGVCDQNFANEANGSSCNDSLFCNGTDTCSAGACSGHTGSPCPGADGDGNCAESCNEATDACTAADPGGSACNDGLFCNGADTCAAGSCNGHAGNPCPGADGDVNCSESCNEISDNCSSPDPDGSTCRAAAGLCDEVETCVGGACPGDAVKPMGAVCNPGSGDICDVDEICDGGSASCPPDSITPSGTPCRAGSGDACDPTENCTGVANAACPADIVQSAATVCRTGSGDSCDPNETCPGTAGQPCPPDVVQPAATVCRAGSGDLCDAQEVCSGTAGQPCPANVMQPNTAVCRTGSGDMCDTDELCPGVIGGACPADVVAPSTTVCRNGVDLCDFADTCTGVAGAVCPPDAKQPASTPCRSAAQPCDLVEVCDGSSDTCPPDELAPDGASCSDGQFCNGEETCQSAVCLDQADPCSLSSICNESADMCQTNLCPAAPQGACRTAVKSLLIVKNKEPDDSKDKLIWKFIKGQPTTQDDFSDPIASADYALCIYAGATQDLVGTVHVPPGPPWSAVSTVGYKYLDPSSAAGGAQKILLKGTGASGRTKIILKARGTEAPDPLDLGALADPVTAQLINYDNGFCWGATYNTAVKSTDSLYKGKR